MRELVKGMTWWRHQNLPAPMSRGFCKRWYCTALRTDLPVVLSYLAHVILSIRTGRWIPPVRSLLQSAQTPHTACQGIHMELTQNFGSNSRYTKRSMIFQISANYLTIYAFTLQLYFAAVCVYGRPLDSPWHTGQLWLHYPLSSSGCWFFILGSESLFVMIAVEV